MIDHHVDRPDVQARQRAQLTGPNRPTGSRSSIREDGRAPFVLGSRPRMSNGRPPPCAAVSHTIVGHDRRADNATRATRLGTRQQRTRTRFSLEVPRVPRVGPPTLGWTTWWLWRGHHTRSHPELGREMPQRPWYCASRRGRVGRRQVFQPRAGLRTASLHTRGGAAR